MRKLLIAAGASVALGAGLAAAAPALAQSTVDELTVTGQWNGRGGPPATLSRVVTFDDLDLRNGADQAVLRDRVTRAAADVCDELGQDRPNHTNLGRSCQDMAVAGAMDQVRIAVADAYARPPVAAYVAPVGEGADTAYVAPAVPPETSAGAAIATSAETAAAPASYSTTTVSNGPVPDTPANRAKYGQPMSHAGKLTTPAGN